MRRSVSERSSWHGRLHRTLLVTAQCPLVWSYEDVARHVSGGSEVTVGPLGGVPRGCWGFSVFLKDSSAGRIQELGPTAALRLSVTFMWLSVAKLQQVHASLLIFLVFPSRGVSCHFHCKYHVKTNTWKLHQVRQHKRRMSLLAKIKFPIDSNQSQNVFLYWLNEMQCKKIEKKTNQSDTILQVFPFMNLKKRRQTSRPPTCGGWRHWSPLRPSAHVSRQTCALPQRTPVEVRWWGTIRLKGSVACQ